MNNRVRQAASLAAPRAVASALPRVAQPLQEFLSTEAAGGVLLLVAAIAAMIWANVPGDSYADFWGAHVGIDFNRFTLDESLHAWVSDGLMTVFFFIAGMEIKRELLQGELAGRHRATLPVAAALGGMVAPALIYTAFNAGGDGARGWGIPMATDIAFAVGVLALLGERVPPSLKVFLLALAIADDLGAIVVIAVFYSDGIDAGWLATAGAALLAVVALRRVGVRHLLPYCVVGLTAWLAMHESGVHATIAGVAMGLLTPSRPYEEPDALDESAGELVSEFQRGRAQGTRIGHERSQSALRALETLSRDSRAPLDRLQHALHPWSSFAIIPVFALANAGIKLDGNVLRDAATSPVTGGVMLGLVLGKPLGIMLFSWLTVRAGLAVLPAGVRWTQLAGVAAVAGIGFTVSLFVTGLAFTDVARTDDARIGILCGSILMAVAGLILLMLEGQRERPTASSTPD
jgi:NhaA family Na+:H+ antiporter